MRISCTTNFIFLHFFGFCAESVILFCLKISFMFVLRLLQSLFAFYIRFIALHELCHFPDINLLFRRFLLPFHLLVSLQFRFGITRISFQN